MFRFAKSITIIALIAALASCASRYRLDTYMTFEEATSKIKVRATQLVIDAAIGEPRAEEKLVPGTGDVLVVTFATRWHPVVEADYPVLQFDENFTGMFYLELPTRRMAGTKIDLKGASLIQILGRYEVPREAKLFLPEIGTAVIDSIVSNRSYFTINGTFANDDGKEMALMGQFRAKTEN